MKYPCCLIRRYSISSNTGTREDRDAFRDAQKSSVLQTFSVCWLFLLFCTWSELSRISLLFEFFLFFFSIMKYSRSFLISSSPVKKFHTTICGSIVFPVCLISRSILLEKKWHIFWWENNSGSSNGFDKFCDVRLFCEVCLKYSIKILHIDLLIACASTNPFKNYYRIY